MSDSEDPLQDDANDPLQDDNTPAISNELDEDTLRVMISTDNHLGYAELDPIRGDDSFAAFEEVLVLAKRHNCDMVLLAGDLFHENKPTRQTMHKTMNILRRHCMGPDPVAVQIVSDQAQNFRSTVHGMVNYEDPFSSVDMPIFAIHGNHDDPTRDGGTDMLAALDLLAVTNLVNYFGRHDEVDKVQVSPVLLKKGNTKVALYGMGSMRDERLNRMWQAKKIRFLKPDTHSPEEDSDNGSGDEGTNDDGWFNIFALHQNRDLGRGGKNCVHESMIPEWMDLVVWGHEHECLVHPAESAVGTFRITQPGSSVATSLTEGESVRKHVGILDVRGSQFRVTPVPLLQVRSFAVGHISLKDCGIDPTDPRVDDLMAGALETEVNKLMEEATSECRLIKLLKNLRGNDISSGDLDTDLHKQLKFQVRKPEYVLVRLRVEHSGFTTLHNQRFGSRFMDKIANPGDILLFHRKKDSSKTSRKKSVADKLSMPELPVDLNEVKIDDIVKDTLGSSEQQLVVLEETKLADAVDDFVSKEVKQSISDAVNKILKVTQRKLVTRGKGKTNEDGFEDDANMITSATAVREVCEFESQKSRGTMMDVDDGKGSKKGSQKKFDSRGRGNNRGVDEKHYDDDKPVGRKGATTKRNREIEALDEDSDEDYPSTQQVKRASTTRSKSSRSRFGMGDLSDDDAASPKTKPTKKRKKYDFSEDELDTSPQRKLSSRRSAYKDDSRNSDVEAVQRPARSTRGRAARSKKSYTIDSDDDDDDFVDDNDPNSGNGWGTARSTPPTRYRRR